MMATMDRVEAIILAIKTFFASRMIKNRMRIYLTKKRGKNNVDSVEERFFTGISEKTMKILSTKGWLISAAHAICKYEGEAML